MPDALLRQLILPLDVAEPPRTSRRAVPRASRDPQRALGLAAALADRLAQLLDERVRLTLTENTSTMVSFRRTRTFVDFRAHAMFVHAPEDVVRALADYACRGRNDAGRIIDEYVRRNEEKVRRARTERQLRSLIARGAVHDLQAHFDELNAQHFEGRIEAQIGWGREPPARRRRSIKMGTYFHDARVIRLHPALDRPEVPDFFVRFIVFHEMLHQAVPPVRVGDRRIAHCPAFRARERAYPDYARALAWERRHLPLLLQKRRPKFDPDDPLA